MYLKLNLIDEEITFENKRLYFQEGKVVNNQFVCFKLPKFAKEEEIYKCIEAIEPVAEQVIQNIDFVRFENEKFVANCCENAQQKIKSIKDFIKIFKFN